MTDKSIEIYYDIADIPNISDRSEFSSEALKFRNAAMEQIEQALIQANAGEWEGAEIGLGEVNFGFGVKDFDLAEATVYQAVAGTKFENIREIARHELSPEDIAEMQADHEYIRPLGLIELIGVLVFRRMPKRFRSN